MAKDLFDAIYGCLIGAAIGDALGAPVEGWAYWEIREKYGRLDDLIASAGNNSNQQPGGVTDGTALRQYITLTIIRKGGRITPDDLAALWLEKGNAELFWSNERAIFERLSSGMNPWDAGRGAKACGTATMAIAPIGIINVGNPSQAYQDGYTIASVNQDGKERDAAGTLAAGIAASISPDATLDGVVGTMTQQASNLMVQAIELTLELAAVSSSIPEFTERYYERMAGCRMAQPAHDPRLVPDGYPSTARFYSGSSLELIPVSLALLKLCHGDVEQSLIEGANFGRDCDTIASIMGSIAGALAGAAGIRGDWVETCEQANWDLFEFLEDDPSANFYSTAWRLVKTIEAERQAAKSRLALLDRVVRW